MTNEINAYQFPEVYEDLGLSLSKLGVVMLDVDPGDLDHRIREIVSPEDLYTSDDPNDHFTGVLGGEPHVTLVYGLLRTGTEMQKHIMRVLEDGAVLPESVEIDEVGYFESRRADQSYYCIVAHLKITPELAECNERLKLLPHLNTFPGYKPHMTLCYIRQDEELRDSVVYYLNTILRGSTLSTGELNMGDE